MRSPKKRPAPVDRKQSKPDRQSDTASHRVRHTYAQGLTDPRQIRSAEALRAALLRLLERKSFDEITVKEISTEAGVHHATFFRHHADKQALLNDVAADEINRLVDFSLPFGHHIEGNRALCEYVSKHRVLWKALLNGGAGGSMREEYLRVSQNVAANYKGAASWLPHDLSVTISTMLIVETVSWWLDQKEGAYSPDEVADMIDRLTSVPISKKAPPRSR